MNERGERREGKEKGKMGKARWEEDEKERGKGKEKK